jgi:hypothetical protein
MYRKIDVFVNGIYQFSTTRYKTAKELINHIRAVKHLYIASIPARYLTVYDYDKVTTKQH